MNNLMKLTLAATLLSALPAWACTPEEATAKREELVKAKQMNSQLQKMDLDTESAEFPDKCQLIDARLKELREATGKR